MASFSERLLAAPGARMSKNVIDLTLDPMVNMLRSMNNPMGNWDDRTVDPRTGDAEIFGPDIFTQRAARRPGAVTSWPMPYRGNEAFVPGPDGKLMDVFHPPVTPATNAGFQSFMRQLMETYTPQSFAARPPQPMDFSTHILKQAAK